MNFDLIYSLTQQIYALDDEILECTFALVDSDKIRTYFINKRIKELRALKAGLTLAKKHLITSCKPINSNKPKTITYQEYLESLVRV
jgi:hypothetical protein